MQQVGVYYDYEQIITLVILLLPTSTATSGAHLCLAQPGRLRKGEEKVKHRGNEHHLQERKGGRVALTEHLLYATCLLSTIFGAALAT